MGVSRGGQPGGAGGGHSAPDVLQCFGLVVGVPGGRLDARPDATAPSAHYVGDVGERAMGSAEPEPEVAPPLFLGQAGKEVEDAKTAPHLVFDEVEDRIRVVLHSARF